MQAVVGGLLTNYEVIGSGNRRILIMHGWGGNLEDWRRVASDLGTEYKVVLVDLPGFGRTQRPGGVWGVEEYAGWVSNFLDKMKIKRTAILGHSFGGRIAIALATGKFKKKVERLILVDAAGVEMKSIKVRALAAIAPYFRWLPDDLRRLMRARDYQRAGEMREIYKKMVGENLRGRLQEVGCPTLIVWGEKDLVLSFEEAKLLREGIRGAKLRIVWGASHWPQMEKPEELMRIIKEEL